MTLFVVRHAKVTTPGICYGQSDVPTELDDDAACEVVAQQMTSFPVRIARVWSSPWQRTRGPAERLAARLGLPLTVDPRLSELAFGAWEGRSYAELEDDAAFRSWMEHWETAAPPHGERLEQLLSRVSHWRREARSREEGVLAFTHAGVIRALRAESRRVAYADVVAEVVEHLQVQAIQ